MTSERDRAKPPVIFRSLAGTPWAMALPVLIVAAMLAGAVWLLTGGRL